MIVLIGIVLCGCAVVYTILAARRHGAREWARGLEAYRLLLPASLDLKAVANWLGMAATTTAVPQWSARAPAVFGIEIRASARGIEHFIVVPSFARTTALQSVRAGLPGARLEPALAHMPPNVSYAVELALTTSRRPLAIERGEAVATAFLTSLQPLYGADSISAAFYFAGAGTPKLVRAPKAQSSRGIQLNGWRREPDAEAIRAQRAKDEEPLLLVAARVGASSPTSRHARAIALRSVAALRGMNAPGVRIAQRLVASGTIADRMARRSLPLTKWMLLNTNELAGICGLPVGGHHIVGLPQASSRQLPATTAVPSRGLVLCTANFPGGERPLALTPDDLCKHLHIIGPTGTGKTVLCSNLAVQMMRNGYGLVAIESKGDLFHSILERIPRKRLDDVIVIDVSDNSFPIGFNVLSEGNPRATVEELCALFEHLYNDAHSVWTRELLYYGLSTLVSRPGLTFVDLAPLLAPSAAEEAWRTGLVDSLSDPELKGFWERFRAQPHAAQSRMAQPVLDRVWQLNARPEIRNIIGQSRSSFHMADVMAKDRILLVNLSGLGKATASLVGTLLVNALWRAVQAVPRSRPAFLLLDEFQDFIRLPVAPADMFAKARSRKLGIVAAHQDLGQLPLELQKAILANARSKVVFQTTADDAHVFAREFGRAVADTDFLNLGRYEVLCRLATDSGVSAPVSGVTLAPPREGTWAQEARTLSTEKYGRPASAVEAEIAERRTAAKQPSARRPRLGGQEWG